jgi:hypothetical protein
MGGPFDGSKLSCERRAGPLPLTSPPPRAAGAGLSCWLKRPRRNDSAQSPNAQVTG